MRAFSLVFLVVFAAAVGGFAYFNNYPVPVNLFGLAQQEVPMPLLAGAVYLLGMLTGWAVVGMLKRSWTRATEYDRR